MMTEKLEQKVSIHNYYICGLIDALCIFLQKETRAVMIICSNQVPAPSEEIITPLTPANLSEDDRQVLSDLGLPQDKWDNLNALLALYDKTEYYDVFSVQPGMELSCSYILEQIKFFLRNSTKKAGGG